MNLSDIDKATKAVKDLTVALNAAARHKRKVIKSLVSGQKIYFEGEGVPMELMARSARYGIVMRPLDIKEDFDLIYFEVERGAYSTTKEAYEASKYWPVYSLLDFKKDRRGPSNMIFDTYDYTSKNDCIDSIVGLKKGTHEISERHGTELLIDWNRTLKNK